MTKKKQPKKNLLQKFEAQPQSATPRITKAGQQHIIPNLTPQFKIPYREHGITLGQVRSAIHKEVENQGC